MPNVDFGRVFHDIRHECRGRCSAREDAHGVVTRSQRNAASTASAGSPASPAAQSMRAERLAAS
ncbi:hypothetical protein N136_04614 [Leifsonia aquatica ATCC 14665]|uniref:Uncharacterized protein n=1 Tax=Leifsonia aquatica ATCC 14665 TaxID=1358026 RepID=U2SZ61_LEIAQ|nr:hypothetical protein N136_04614 [Leifsonia aquatica ATCC 14665]